MCVFLFGGLLYTAFQNEADVSTAAGTDTQQRVFVIDPGHGGEDGGSG